MTKRIDKNLIIGLDIGTSMLASIIIGAGVDYAVHLLAAWRCAEGEPLAKAAARSAPSPTVDRETRCCPGGAYVGATLLITATWFTGPTPSPSSTRSGSFTGGEGAAK